MRQKYTRVNIVRCANLTLGNQIAHANAQTKHTGVNLQMGKFTTGSDKMKILFLQIHKCKFTVMSHANAK